MARTSTGPDAPVRLKPVVWRVDTLNATHEFDSFSLMAQWLTSPHGPAPADHIEIRRNTALIHQGPLNTTHPSIHMINDKECDS